ncbi:MAG: response regulator [Blastocatellia bacterium]|nr:response regulator [Blastocatellia bacterium]
MARLVLAAVGDMIFASKIDGSARFAGVEVKFFRKLENLLLSAAELKPSMIVLDLNNVRFNSIEAIAKLKSNEMLKNIPVTAFLSHVQVGLRRSAEDAGCDHVMARSEFNANLTEILSGNYVRIRKRTADLAERDTEEIVVDKVDDLKESVG